MTREKSFFGLLGRAFFLHSRKRTQRSLWALSGRFLCALCVLLRPILRFRLRRPRLFAAAAVVLSQSLCAQTPRLEVIHAMLQRPHDPWPRGKGHVVLAVPGCADASKGYHEPGGSFSPSFGSFGVSIWITDSAGKIVATSDMVVSSAPHVARDCLRLILLRIGAIDTWDPQDTVPTWRHYQICGADQDALICL